jgi:hypothetical protein
MHPTQETPGSEQRQPLVVLRGSTRKHHHTVADSLRIDPDFQTLIPPLSASEFATLEASIQEKGCRDPLVVWAEEKISFSVVAESRYEYCRNGNILKF